MQGKPRKIVKVLSSKSHPRQAYLPSRAQAQDKRGYGQKVAKYQVLEV
jgi:hypothetical protein